MHFYGNFIQTRWGQIRIEWVVYTLNNIKYSNIQCRGPAMQKYLVFKAIQILEIVASISVIVIQRFLKG